MKATIHDVAKRAGVSVATVSRVVNNNYPVKASTRERVMEAIRTLEYVPNMQARELNLRHSTTVGVVIPSIGDATAAGALEGLEAALRLRSYSLLLASSQGKIDQEAACVRDFMGRNVCGIAILRPHRENWENNFYEDIARRMPLAFIDSDLQIPQISCVSIDRRKGTAAALMHLLWLGHQRILFAGGSENDIACRIQEETYRSLMEEAGLLNESYIVRTGNGDYASIIENATRALRIRLKTSNASAIFCSNDFIAAGALQACQRAGKSVPEDISVMGFDNAPISQWVNPQLTTMDRSSFRMGERAAELLLAQISGAEPQQERLEYELLERRTTARCKEL